MLDASTQNLEIRVRKDGLGETASLIAKGLRRPALSPTTLNLIAKAFDWIAIGLGIWFANFFVMQANIAISESIFAALLSATVTVIVLGSCGQHRLLALGKPIVAQVRAIAIAVLVAAIGQSVGLWSGAGLPFVSVVFFAVMVCMMPGRILLWALARWIRDHGLMERRAVLVGGGANAAELIRGLSKIVDNDIRICGIFDDRDDVRSPQVIIGVPKIGGVDELLEFARTAEIDMLIITLPLDAEKRIRQIISKVSVLPVDVRMSAFSSGYSFPRRTGGKQSDEGLIDVSRRPMTWEGRFSKRVMDTMLVLPVIFALSPVMLLTALAIRMENKGPVLFKQLRYGYNHKPIEILKFRSMYTDECDVGARNIVVRDDPRVTRVGRFIRKWSIDELPQLFNVLRGDVSLVGPRPHALNAVSSRQTAFEEIVDGYAARHKVPPGVTGWAQINGWRGEIDEPEKLRKRVEHDLYYIENRSIWLDLKIMSKTPLCLLNTRNAY